jgi:plastocyanin
MHGTTRAKENQMRTTITRTAAVTTGLATAVLLLAGCGSSSSSTAASPPSSSMSSMSMSPSSSTSASTGSEPAMKSMIMIKNFAFTGPTSVKAGSTVTVMNMDSEAHTVTADSSSGGFDVTVPAGATKTFTAPAKPGDYPYHCNFHSNMHGTLKVT